jgi:hypothetical protein
MLRALHSQGQFMQGLEIAAGNVREPYSNVEARRAPGSCMLVQGMRKMCAPKATLYAEPS